MARPAGFGQSIGGRDLSRSVARSSAGRIDSFQWLLRSVHDRDVTSPVIVAPAANTNIVVSRRTPHRRLPRGPKRQQKRLLDRLRRKRRLPHEYASPRRISHGRRPRLVASSRALARLARSVAVDRGHPRIRPRFRLLTLWLEPVRRLWTEAGRAVAQTNPKVVARPPRLERGTPGLEGRCSIQLSYGRVP